MLSIKNLNLPVKLNRKLSPRFIRPFTILKKIGQVTFLLDMKYTKWHIHLVFYIDRLIPYHKNNLEIFPDKIQEPPSPI